MQLPPTLESEGEKAKVTLFSVLKYFLAIPCARSRDGSWGSFSSSKEILFLLSVLLFKKFHACHFGTFFCSIIIY